MATASESLKKHLECTICLETIKEPKMLTCQHTYCRECLENLVKKDGRCAVVIICPECRTKTEVRSKEIILYRIIAS